MPKTLSPADIESFRARLCDVAEKQFASHGPNGVTMRELADALGVSSMTPYRYFKDKDSILAAVRTRAFNRFAATMEAAAPSGRSESGNAYLDFALANPAAYRLMFDVSQPTFANYPELVAAMDRAASPWVMDFANWPPPDASRAMWSWRAMYFGRPCMAQSCWNWPGFWMAAI